MERTRLAFVLRPKYVWPSLTYFSLGEQQLRAVHLNR
jgi:hypothetical protein